LGETKSGNLRSCGLIMHVNKVSHVTIIDRGGPAFLNRMAAWLRWILGSITPPISPRLPA